MKDTKDELKLFIPDYKDNLNLDESGQIRVYYKELPYKAAQRYAAKYGKTINKQEQAQRKLFIDHVDRIENYWIGEDEIKTGADLYDHPNAKFALVSQIIRAIEGNESYDEDAEKN